MVALVFLPLVLFVFLSLCLGLNWRRGRWYGRFVLGGSSFALSAFSSFVSGGWSGFSFVLGWLGPASVQLDNSVGGILGFLLRGQLQIGSALSKES